MKSWTVRFAAVAALLVCGFATAQTRVMNVGASIVNGGEGGYASFRYPLWFQLRDAGYDVDFVGRLSTVAGGDGNGNPDEGRYPRYYTDFDRDHEGRSGFRTDEISDLITAATVAGQPDFVLIHAGTNDIGMLGAGGVANADANLRTIIARIRAVRPDVTVLLSQLIPIGPGTSYFDNADLVPQVNTAIADIAADLSTAQSPVILVDQNSGFDLATMMQPDGLHPNQAGEAQMANVWYAALAPRLPPGGGEPSTPVPVVNPSFELPALGDGQLAEGPATIAGWNFEASTNIYVGIANPSSLVFAGAGDNNTPVGAQGVNGAYAFNYGGEGDWVCINQTLTSTVAAATSYTLRVSIGRPLPRAPDDPFFASYGGYRIELLAGDTVIAVDSDTIVPESGEFRDATAVVAAEEIPAELIGQPLSIQLTISSSEAARLSYFDNVQLMAYPE